MESQVLSVVARDKTATRKFDNCVKQLSVIDEFNKTEFVKVNKDLSVKVVDNTTLTEMKELSESITNPKLSVLFDLKRISTAKQIYKQSLKE